MRRLILATLLAVSLIGLGSVPTTPTHASATTVTTSQTIFIDFVIQGCTEPIELSGNLHELFHVTAQSSGGFQLILESNPQGVTGVGLVTGTKYQGTGVGTTQVIVPSSGTFVVTAVNSFKIIGQGEGRNNLLVQETFHITVNPDGTVTAAFDKLSVRCNG